VDLYNFTKIYCFLLTLGQGTKASSFSRPNRQSRSFGSANFVDLAKGEVFAGIVPPLPYDVKVILDDLELQDVVGDRNRRFAAFLETAEAAFEAGFTAECSAHRVEPGAGTMSCVSVIEFETDAVFAGQRTGEELSFFIVSHGG
jgi:hypothetical protein